MRTAVVIKYMLAICVLMIPAAAIHAQQRPSERTMATEIQKINAKRAERNANLSRSQQATATSATSVPAQNTNTKPVSNTNTLPSQRPIQKPVKPMMRKATTIPANSTGGRPG